MKPWRILAALLVITYSCFALLNAVNQRLRHQPLTRSRLSRYLQQYAGWEVIRHQGRGLRGGSVISRAGDSLQSNSSFCSVIETYRKELPEVFLFVGILSYKGRSENRQAIRESWLPDDSGSIDGEFIAYRFIIAEDDIDDATKEEMTKYNDVVIGTKSSGYHNIMYKTMKVFDYSSKNYNSKFVLKTDDDTFVDLPRLIKDLKSTCKNVDCMHEKTYYGRFLKETPVHLKDRGGYEQWDNREYFERTTSLTYIPYASGAGYVVAGDLSLALSLVYDTVGYLHNNIEDASVGWWLSGMNAEWVDKPLFTAGGDCCVDESGSPPNFRLTVNPCNHMYGPIFHKVSKPAHMQAMGGAIKNCIRRP